MSLPSTSIVPLVRSRSRFISLRRVVLPQPEEPRRTRVSPSWISRETLLMAKWCPSSKDLETCFNEIKLRQASGTGGFKRTHLPLGRLMHAPSNMTSRLPADVGDFLRFVTYGHGAGLNHFLEHLREMVGFSGNEQLGELFASIFPFAGIDTFVM